MTVARMRTWREWLYQTFVRHGYFSVRPLPATEAEEREGSDRRVAPRDITRLNLDSQAAKKPD